MQLVITSIGGYPKLNNMILPITVNAEYFYKGCYRVYAEEFRHNSKFRCAEWSREMNQGKGLSFSFFDENNYHLLTN